MRRKITGYAKILLQDGVCLNHAGDAICRVHLAEEGDGSGRKVFKDNAVCSILSLKTIHYFQKCIFLLKTLTSIRRKFICSVAFCN